jgi:hypothetical protein
LQHSSAFSVVANHRLEPGPHSRSTANTWRSALFKALAIQAGLVEFLSLAWFGLTPGFGGADNPLWFYMAAVLQFPASLLFTTVLGPITKVFPDDIQSLEVAGAAVAILPFALIAGVIKTRKSGTIGYREQRIPGSLNFDVQ